MGPERSADPYLHKPRGCLYGPSHDAPLHKPSSVSTGGLRYEWRLALWIGRFHRRHCRWTYHHVSIALCSVEIHMEWRRSILPASAFAQRDFDLTEILRIDSIPSFAIWFQILFDPFYCFVLYCHAVRHKWRGWLVGWEKEVSIKAKNGTLGTYDFMELHMQFFRVNFGSQHPSFLNIFHIDCPMANANPATVSDKAAISESFILSG